MCSKHCEVITHTLWCSAAYENKPALYTGLLYVVLWKEQVVTLYSTHLAVNQQTHILWVHSLNNPKLVKHWQIPTVSVLDVGDFGLDIGGNGTQAPDKINLIQYSFVYAVPIQNM